MVVVVDEVDVVDDEVVVVVAAAALVVVAGGVNAAPQAWRAKASSSTDPLAVIRGLSFPNPLAYQATGSRPPVAGATLGTVKLNGAAGAAGLAIEKSLVKVA